METDRADWFRNLFTPVEFEDVLEAPTPPEALDERERQQSALLDTQHLVGVGRRCVENPLGGFEAEDGLMTIAASILGQDISVEELGRILSDLLTGAAKAGGERALWELSQDD